MSSAFNLINQYFDQVYVLTLERAHERHAAIRKCLKGLQYRFFFSVDKQGIDLAALTKSGLYNPSVARNHHRYRKEMEPGQLGCALGHRMIYEDMLKQGFKHILILEDDVEPSADLSYHLVKNILSELPYNWDLFYLDYSKNLYSKPLKRAWYHIQHALGLLNWSHTIIRNLYPYKYSDHLKKAGFHDYTSAYAISASGARQLLQMQTPVSYVADNLLATAATSEILNAFISLPRLFIQLSQGSNASEGSMVAG